MLKISETGNEGVLFNRDMGGGVNIRQKHAYGRVSQVDTFCLTKGGHFW